MYAQLGEHIFKGLKSPSSQTESSATKWAVIPRINKKDAIQPTGEDLMEITLSIQYAVDFCDPTAEIAALEKSRRDCEVLPFIMGDGTIVGAFVITNIDKTTLKTSPTGTIEAATVVVSLLENADAEVPEPVGTALESQTPTAEEPVAAVPTPSNEITADIAAAGTKVSKMKQVITDIKKQTTQLRQGVRQVRRLSNDAKQLYSSAKTKVAATKKIIQRASQLPTSLDEAIRYAENLAALDNVADVSVLEMNVNQLSESANTVNGKAAPVVSFSATREGGK